MSKKTTSLLIAGGILLAVIAALLPGSREILEPHTLGEVKAMLEEFIECAEGRTRLDPAECQLAGIVYHWMLLEGFVRPDAIASLKEQIEAAKKALVFIGALLGTRGFSEETELRRSFLLIHPDAERTRVRMRRRLEIDLEELQ